MDIKVAAFTVREKSSNTHSNPTCNPKFNPIRYILSSGFIRSDVHVCFSSILKPSRNSPSNLMCRYYSAPLINIGVEF